MEVPIPIPPIAIPNEIISEILSHLGKNDLLKCRLVSQSWNELSLKILRNPKYGHYHELTQDNFQEFLEFSNGRKGEWVLPFHIKCKEEGNPKLYPQIPNYIEQLQTIFGEKCVGGLTLSHNSSSSSLEFVKVLISNLSLIAPSLTYLDLSEFKWSYQEEKVKEMLGETDLNFPNLSKLKSCSASGNVPWLRLIKQENAIQSFLFAKSQNLQELEVVSPYDLLDLQNQIGNLRKLKIVGEFAIEGLDIDTILEPIRTSSNNLPVLKDLSLNYYDNRTMTDHRILHEFLSSFSTSLQSLTVVLEAVPTNPFPRLSQLRLLRIQIPAIRYLDIFSHTRYHVHPTRLNWNSEAFPALESMDICTKIYFESTDSNSGNSKGQRSKGQRTVADLISKWCRCSNCSNATDERSLPTVKNLRIRVMDYPFNKIETAKDYVDHIQQLLPNVTSLTLVNESDGHEENLNQLLTAFIQSDGAPKIQELEIQNCEKNYLGHILNGLDDPDHQPLVIIKNMNLDEEFLKAMNKSFQGFLGGSELKLENQMETTDGVENRVITFKTPIIDFKMTGLEKISMSFNKHFGQSGIDHDHKSNQKDLFLMSLPKNLPLLRQIDISQRMFGDDKEFCKQQIVSVQEKYPDLIINTTR